MTVQPRLLSVAFAAVMTASGPGLGDDPHGSTPSGPRGPRGGEPATGVLQPGLPPGPTTIGAPRHVPPPQPPIDLAAERDAEVDQMVGVQLILIPIVGETDARGPQSLAEGGDSAAQVADNGEQEDCTFTNDMIAVCKIVVCLSDGFCFDTGDPPKCYNAGGEVIPCP